MDPILHFLNSISYKFPKGYPDITNESDMLIIESELKKLNIDLYESKQVGDIYHFTSLETLNNMKNESNKIELDSEYSSNAGDGYYSFTRNPNLKTLGFRNHQVRIKINGDKLSTKYKISPHVDTTSDEDDPELYQKQGPNFESEERISASYGPIDLTPYIESISIIDEPHFLEYLEKDWGGTKQYDSVKQDYYDIIDWLKSKNIPINFISGETATSNRTSNK